MCVLCDGYYCNRFLGRLKVYFNLCEDLYYLFMRIRLSATVLTVSAGNLKGGIFAQPKNTI